MGKEKRFELTLPFSGFYETKWSDMIEQEEESYVEWQVDIHNEDGESRFAPDFRIDSSDYHEILFAATNYRECYNSIASDYPRSFAAQLAHESNIDLKSMKFVTMVSPREYNFTTDRIFASINLTDLKKLFAVSKADNHETLAKVIAGRHSNRDGFISFYSNTLDSWLKKPLRDWDHNEIGTLLITCMEIEGIDREDFEWSIYQDWADSGHQDWEAGVDWSKVKELVADKRHELEMELKAKNPEYVMPTPRCSKTLDLFECRS